MRGIRALGVGRVAFACALAAITVVIAATTAAAEEPERDTVELTPPGPAGWTGTQGNGANQSYDAASGEPCGDAAEDMCDTTLLHVNVPTGFWDTNGGLVELTIDNFTVPASDFDLYVYE